MAADKPKLTYFPFPGRVFGVRVAMFKAFGKDGWIDDRVPFAEFGEKKAAGEYPLGAVPVLTLPDGRTICQSAAIGAWAARQGGLMPTDITECLVVEELMATLQEVLAKTPSDPDNEVKKAKREEYAAGWMKGAMVLLEKRYSVTASAFLMDEICLADFMLWGVVNMIQTGDFDYVDPAYVADYPKLVAAAEAVKSHPITVSYFENYEN